MDDLSRLERNLVEQMAPWDRFHAWAHGICVVTFDLELGQGSNSMASNLFGPFCFFSSLFGPFQKLLTEMRHKKQIDPFYMLLN